MRLLPVEFGFFDHFEKHVERSIEGTTLFLEMLDDMENSGPKAKRIKEVEHEADVLTHETVEMLHKTFITPFDRDQIFRLASRMDDILDCVEAVRRANKTLMSERSTEAKAEAAYHVF